jgi:hypothetical protein
LLGVGTLGILAFCSGISFYMNSQFATARWLLVAANAMVLPLFVYLIVLRGRASAEYRRRARKRKAHEEAEAQRQLAALAHVDEILQANDKKDGGDTPT